MVVTKNEHNITLGQDRYLLAIRANGFGIKNIQAFVSFSFSFT